jgi:hypothetical protein
LGDSRHPLYVLIVSLSLANCYFAQDSSRFPVLFFHPFHRHPGSVARSWRRPFPSRGVPSPQAPTLDRESLPTILQSLRVGPHSCRLDGTLGATNSSATFRNCTEAFDTASPSQSYGQAKVLYAVLPESPSEARPERTERRTRSRGRRNEATQSELGVVRESHNRSPWRSTSNSTKTWFAGFSPITTCQHRTPMVPPG